MSKCTSHHHACACREEEFARIKEELEDINETYRVVIEEKCPSDEQHCTCVPFLRMEIDRLKRILDQVHDRLLRGDNDKELLEILSEAYTPALEGGRFTTPSARPLPPEPHGPQR